MPSHRPSRRRSGHIVGIVARPLRFKLWSAAKSLRRCRQPAEGHARGVRLLVYQHCLRSASSSSLRLLPEVDDYTRPIRRLHVVIFRPREGGGGNEWRDSRT